jgi:hypothetical protein
MLEELHPIRPLSDIELAVATQVTRILFVARHLAQLPDCRIVWQSYDSGRLRVQLGFISAFLYP